MKLLSILGSAVWLACFAQPTLGQDKEQETSTLKGRLEWKNISGGVWILKVKDKVYDLHGNKKLFEGFKSGDPAEVKGKVNKGGMCIHMAGTIFDVELIKKGTGDKEDVTPIEQITKQF